MGDDMGKRQSQGWHDRSEKVESTEFFKEACLQVATLPGCRERTDQLEGGPRTGPDIAQKISLSTSRALDGCAKLRAITDVRMVMRPPPPLKARGLSYRWVYYINTEGISVPTGPSRDLTEKLDLDPGGVTRGITRGVVGKPLRKRGVPERLNASSGQCR